MTIYNNTLLPFTDDFIFSLVMRSPEICKGLLERILPEEEFSKIEIMPNGNPLLNETPISVETQKTLKFDYASHGVRFDAFVQTQKIWAEVEMQTYSREFIGKRSRYYHANMDIDFLDAGKSYKNLKRSYVIFICTFDYIGKGAPVYHYCNYDIKTETYLDDDSHTIILNTACPLEKVPDRLKPLYAYINDSSRCDDPFIKELDSYVRKYNRPEWRKKQMTLEHLMERERERINHLIILLAEAGRTEDIIKAAKNPEYQKKLFEEFDL